MISRYSVKKINNIFSDRQKYKNWLKIEIILLRYLSGCGYLKKEEVENIEKEIAIFPEKIREEEKRINHDVAAFVNCISKTVSSDAKKWIHFGLTSSDLVDTGNAMMLKEANQVILDYAYRLLRRLKYLSYKHKKTYYLQRKGGKIRGLSSFGHTISKYYSLTKELIDRFTALRKHVECVSMSGSVGTCSYLGTDIQEYAANELGLFSVPISTQVVSRDRYFSYFSILASFGQVINKLSLELRLLTKTEIGEISEGFGEEQIGSSSMPHKKNPITLENICGLFRLLEGYLSSSSKNSLIWFERDISHSSVDRVLFVDAISIVVQMMKRMNRVLDGIFVNKKMMKRNIDKNLFTIIKPRIHRFLMFKKMFYSHAEADFYLEQINKKSKEEGISFKQVFEDNFDYRKANTCEVHSLFDFDVWFGYLDGEFKKIFGDSMERSDFEEIYYENSEIKYAIDTLAERLNYVYRNAVEPIRILALRDGCSAFLSEIIFKFTFPVELKTLNVSLMEYLKLNDKGIPKNIEMEESLWKKRNVLVLDELIDTGSTIDEVKKHLKKYKARSIRTCVLFAVKNGEVLKKVDYYGLLVETAKNLAGFGVDIQGKYRNLKFVGRIKNLLAPTN